MFDNVDKFITTLIQNPTQALLIGALLLFIYLYLEKKKSNEKLKNKLNEEKQQFYIELILFLNRVIRSKADIKNPEEMDKLIELDSKTKLYSNDNVLKAWADFWHCIFQLGADEKNNKLMFDAYGLLQIEIRKDIGSSSWRSDLKWYDLMRSMVNDLDDYLESDEKEYRNYQMKKTIKAKIDNG